MTQSIGKNIKFSAGILISSTMINAEFTSLKLPAVLRMPKTIQHKNFCVSILRCDVIQI